MYWTKKHVLVCTSNHCNQKGAMEVIGRLRLGIVRKNVYMTFGPYDFVQVIEAPNDEAVAKYVLSVNSKGNVRTTTMRAFDEPEHFEFIKSLP